MLSERELIHFVQEALQSPAGQIFSIVCARWLIFTFAILAAWTGLRKRGRPRLRHAAYEAAWAAMVALLLALTIEHFVGRPRPFLVFPEIHLLIPPPRTGSFPSSHSSVAFALAFAFLSGDKRRGMLALAMACLVAFGRVAVGVHYPSDVIAGIGVGLLAFLVVRAGHHALRTRDLSA